MILRLTRADFIENIYDFEGHHAPQNQNSRHCVIFFYTDEDRNCTQQYSILESLADQYSAIMFFKVDVKKEPLLAADLGVRHIPSLLFVMTEAKFRLSSGLFSGEELSKAFYDLFGIRI